MEDLVVFDFLLTRIILKSEYIASVSILYDGFCFTIEGSLDLDHDMNDPILPEFRSMIIAKLEDKIVLGYDIIPNLAKLNIPVETLRGIIDLKESDFLEQYFDINAPPTFSRLVYSFTGKLRKPKTARKRTMFMMEFYRKYEDRLEVKLF